MDIGSEASAETASLLGECFMRGSGRTGTVEEVADIGIFIGRGGFAGATNEDDDNGEGEEDGEGEGV